MSHGPCAVDALELELLELDPHGGTMQELELELVEPELFEPELIETELIELELVELEPVELELIPELIETELVELEELLELALWSTIEPVRVGLVLSGVTVIVLPEVQYEYWGPGGEEVVITLPEVVNVPLVDGALEGSPIPPG